MSTAEAKALKAGDEIECQRFGKGKSRIVGVVEDDRGKVIVMRSLADASGYPFCLTPDQLRAFKKC